jgi:phosphopentomutase
VDFDMVYGHRRDVDGYAKAVNEFDEWLKNFIKNMESSDALIITADHGCDPAFIGTDHTREYVPFILYNKNIAPENLGTIDGFTYISDTVKSLLER